MRVGVVSDTHGHIECFRPAIAELKRLEVDLVLHCGDIGSAAIVEMLSPWPAHFVFGNVDDAETLRPVIVAAGQTCHDGFGELTVEGVRIAFAHGHDRRLLDEAIASGKYDVVCYGHTHRAEWHKSGSVLVLNPGALFRAAPHTFATLDLPATKVRHVAVT